MRKPAKNFFLGKMLYRSLLLYIEVNDIWEAYNVSEDICFNQRLKLNVYTDIELNLSNL